MFLLIKRRVLCVAHSFGYFSQIVSILRLLYTQAVMSLSTALVGRIVQTGSESGRLTIESIGHFFVGFDKLIMCHEPLINRFPLDYFTETGDISMNLVKLPLRPGKQRRIGRILI